MATDTSIYKIDAPRAYHDDFWIDAALKAEKEYKLPRGSLVRVLGAERTNHGTTPGIEISSKGAYTPFQITKETRDAILKKRGYDAFESPENAARAAAEVYKDGLNKYGDENKAYGHYSNFKIDSPDFNAYMARGKSFLKRMIGPDEAMADEGESVDTEQKPLTLSNTQKFNLQQAYESGKMDDKQAADFEADFPDLTVDLERGSLIPQLNDKQKTNMLDAYKTGKMDDTQKADFEADFPNLIEEANVTVPDSRVVDADPSGEIFTPEGGYLGGDIYGTNSKPLTASDFYTPALETAGMVLGTGAGAMTGPAAPVAMPVGAGLGYATGKRASGVLDRALGYDTENAKMDQTAMQAVGSTAKDVVMGAAMDTGMQSVGKLAELGINKVMGDPVAKAVSSVMSKDDFASLVETIGKGGKGAEEAKRELAKFYVADPNIKAAADRIGITPLLEDNIAFFTNNSSAGELSGSVTTMGGTAERAWSGDPDTPGVYQQVAKKTEDTINALSKKGSKGEAIEAIKADLESTAKSIEEGVVKTKTDAENELTRLGAKRDVDEVVNNARDTAEAEIKAAKAKTKVDYDGVEGGEAGITESIGLASDAPATNTIAAIEAKMATNTPLTTLEKELYRDLKSKTTTVEPVPEEGTLAWDRTNLEPVEETTHPSYGNLDQWKRKVTSSKHKDSSLYTDSELGEKIHYENLLAKDQLAAAERAGVGPKLKQAQSDVAARKTKEASVKELYGKKGKATGLTPKLNNAIEQAAKGNGTNLDSLLNNLPAEHQAEAVATSLGKAVRNTDGEIDPEKFVRIYEGLKNNKGLFDKVTSTLGEESAASLESTYKNMQTLLESKGKFDQGIKDKVASLIDGAISSGLKGDTTPLTKLLNSIQNPELKKQAVTEAITSFSREGNEFSFSKYMEFYKNLSEKNPAMYKTIVDTLGGKESHEVLKDLYIISKNMKKVEDWISVSHKSKNELTDALKVEEARIGAIKSTVGRALSLMSYKFFVAPVSASSISGSLHRLLGGNQTAVSQVTKVLASPEFRTAVEQYTAKGVVPKKVVDALAISKPFTDYAKSNSSLKFLTDRQEFVKDMFKENQ